MDDADVVEGASVGKIRNLLLLWMKEEEMGNLFFDELRQYLKTVVYHYCCSVVSRRALVHKDRLVTTVHGILWYPPYPFFGYPGPLCEVVHPKPSERFTVCIGGGFIDQPRVLKDPVDSGILSKSNE